MLGGGKEETGSSGHSLKPGPSLLRVVVTFLQIEGILHWSPGCPGGRKVQEKSPRTFPHPPLPEGSVPPIIRPWKMKNFPIRNVMN